MLKRLHLDQAIQFSIEEFPQLLFEGKITAINSKVDTNTHNILIQATLPNCPAGTINHPETSKLINLKKQDNGEKTIVGCSTELNSENHIKQFAFIPGMFASITVNQPPIPEVVVLPSTAISYSLYGNSVFVIDKDENNKKDKNGKDILRVKRVFVSTGEQAGNFTIIKKGIKHGQQVVSSGELKLQNGASVVINNSVKLDETNNPEKLGQ